MLMSEMVTEAADEILDMQHDKAVTHDAMVLQDAPSLETMLQKLKLMEVNKWINHSIPLTFSKAPKQSETIKALVTQVIV